MPNPIDEKIGTNIKARRLLAGKSMAQLGATLPTPVSFQQIQKFERGVNRVSGSQLYEIAIALGCNIEDLFEYVGPRCPPTQVNKGEIELIRHYRQLTPAMQESVRGFISDIINHEPTRKWMEAGA